MFSISDFPDYLGVDKKDCAQFWARKRRALSKLFFKWGIPLSESSATSKDTKPLVYGDKDVEYMLSSDFGKYAGTSITEDVEVLENSAGIVVFRYRN